MHIIIVVYVLNFKHTKPKCLKENHNKLFPIKGKKHELGCPVTEQLLYYCVMSKDIKYCSQSPAVKA